MSHEQVKGDCAKLGNVKRMNGMQQGIAWLKKGNEN